MATQATGGSPSTDISHLLVEETGRVSGDIYRRTIDTSPWLKLIKQASWPNEMGDTLSVLTYERTLNAGTAQAWNPINSESTSTSFCIPTATEIKNAQTTRTYGLAHTALESSPICVHGVRMGYRFREQLKAVYDNLVENVSWTWKNRYRDQYESWAAHHIVAGTTTAGGSTLLEGSGTLYGGTGMPAKDSSGTGDLVEAQISRLTQGLLDRVYMQLVRDGAGINPMGRENGRPVFTAITSAETSDKIIRESEIRDDYRYSPQVSELLKPLGVERSHRGFYHLIDPFPKRFTYDPAYTGTGGDNARWVEVDPYKEDASWTGKAGSESRFIINPAYETAEYEDTIIFHTDVMESLIPTPLGNAGSGVKFNPLTYRGKFDFLNIKDRVENPDGSWGYFRGVLANAAKPVKPQWGYVIRHKRCDLLTTLDCAGASISGAL